MMERNYPFKVGDIVDCNGHKGIITHIATDKPMMFVMSRNCISHVDIPSASIMWIDDRKGELNELFDVIEHAGEASMNDKVAEIWEESNRVQKHIHDLESIQRYLRENGFPRWQRVMREAISDYKSLLDANNKLSKIEDILDI